MNYFYSSGKIELHKNRMYASIIARGYDHTTLAVLLPNILHDEVIKGVNKRFIGRRFNRLVPIIHNNFHELDFIKVTDDYLVIGMYGDKYLGYSVLLYLINKLEGTSLSVNYAKFKKDSIEVNYLGDDSQILGDIENKYSKLDIEKVMSGEGISLIIPRPSMSMKNKVIRKEIGYLFDVIVP